MTTGMMLGKFMPPHLGHVYLGEFASRFVDRLTIIVGSLQREPIPGELRFQWMRELFPFANVVHLTEELPQYPHEHPDFWALWQASLLRNLPESPDFVFASEDYGWKLAEVLGAQFIPVDQPRSVVPISGTAVRADPIANWEYLPRCVRPYFLKRVCVFGPESTGKTTLARRLAEHFRTVCVPEYARTLLETKLGDLGPDDIPLIARGQMAAEDALARNARGLLVCDTDVLTTTIWSDVLYGSCPSWIREVADRRTYDQYLLLDVDVPWVADVARYLPDNRGPFFARCRSDLERRQRPYVIVRGNWEERYEIARLAVERLLSPPLAAGRT
jgi:NadR type nicotinamide-nucleotide adenylyltransferase